METCPKCGRLLEIVECCGGGIFLCEACKEYFYPGEIINAQTRFEEVSEEDGGQPVQVEFFQPRLDKQPKI